MTRLLSLFGLMRVSEHERACRPLRERLFDSEQKRIHWQGEANEMTAKFKRAATDLAAQAEERDRVIGNLKQIIGKQIDELADLRPDALAMRRKRQMDRDRRKGNG